MNDDLARRSHALLARAMELDDAEREAFVGAACADDPLLHRHVRNLLHAMQDSRPFLDVPALEAVRPPRPRPPAVVADTIGGYRIVRTIGAGGMATVYEAMQEQPRRRVALKVLRQGLAQTSAIDRFRFETEVLARLQHPGIAQIFEAGYFNDGNGFSTPFFAMEYVAGAATITAYAAARRLSLGDRLRLFLPVCEAVQHGHQLGVIHRDIKPGNVLVDADGRPKVIDFGVARASDPAAASITRDAGLGQLVGTLNYMSPEQCDGSAVVDIRSDVYSLGVLLYELVCGRLPHEVSTLPVPEALRVIREDLPPRPAVINDQLRGDVDAIIGKAMEKDAERRYATVAALAADIRRHLASETVEARPPTLTYRAARFVRRHRALLAATTVVMIAIIGGAVLSGIFAYESWQESQRRLQAERDAVVERDAARWQSYVANVAAAHASLQTQEYPTARARLLLAPTEHRGWEWHFLTGMTEVSEAVIPAHEDMIYAFAASRDGQRVATAAADGSLRVWNAATGVLEADNGQVTDIAFHSVAFDSEGERIVTGSADRTVRIWNARTGTPVRILGEHADPVWYVAWGGGRIASASTGGVGRLWDAEAGVAIREFSDQPGGVHGVAFSADGRSLITWGRDGTVQLRDAAGEPIGEPVSLGVKIEVGALSSDGRLFAAGGAEGRLRVWTRDGTLAQDLPAPSSLSAVRAIAFSQDGMRLAAGRIDRTITLYSTLTGVAERGLRGHAEAVSGVAFCGARLVSASWDRTVRIWNIGSRARAGLIPVLQGHADDVLSVAFSPDGAVLASGGRDDSIALWDPDTAGRLGTLGGHADAVSSLAFSPDGRQLASGSYDKTVILWNAWTGAEEDRLEGHQRAIWTVAYSPDGRQLATAGEGGEIRIWDLATRQTRRRLEGHTGRVISVAFSPDGRLLASASRDRSVRLWDIETGREVRPLTPHRLDVFAVLFSADGRRLFSGSRDQTVHVHEVSTGRLEKTLDGHGHFITSLALLPDGSRLAAGSWFGEIMLWDAVKLEPVVSIKAHNRTIRGLAFSPDGRLMASGSYERTVRIFDATVLAERESYQQLCDRRCREATAIVEGLASEHADLRGLVTALLARDDLDPGVRAAARRLTLRRGLAEPAPP
ncbi:MAG: protein kinase [Phycisphaerales bacterium]|nr:protein kinase [Phycisphaerales bacterium]